MLFGGLLVVALLLASCSTPARPPATPAPARLTNSFSTITLTVGQSLRLETNVYAYQIDYTAAEAQYHRYMWLNGKMNHDDTRVEELTKKTLCDVFGTYPATRYCADFPDNISEQKTEKGLQVTFPTALYTAVVK